ncbi:uncharacterized protein PAC_05910 [Phialocephala subalpina]|uniref:Uncharacterized protein n=1 Tax=Phialocephala subalpina TaxID=576137 RepID=A0A1L7WTA8_9HELO|nr:uncharacterized protein PAC_05910 [Phialocephala subalpina]
MHNNTLSSSATCLLSYTRHATDGEYVVLPPFTISVAVALVVVVVLVVGFNCYDKKKRSATRNTAIRIEDRFEEASEMETGRVVFEQTRPPLDTSAHHDKDRILKHLFETDRNPSGAPSKLHQTTQGPPLQYPRHGLHHRSQPHPASEFLNLHHQLEHYRAQAGDVLQLYPGLRTSQISIGRYTMVLVRDHRIDVRYRRDGCGIGNLDLSGRVEDEERSEEGGKAEKLLGGLEQSIEEATELQRGCGGRGKGRRVDIGDRVIRKVLIITQTFGDIILEGT